MTGYTFAITCRGCGAELQHTADGVVRPDATTALATCTECGSLYRIDLRVAVLNGPAIRETLPPADDVACRNPHAPGAPLIAALMEAQR